MRKIKYLITLGISVAILPHLGFPYYLDNIFFAILGILIIFIAYSFKKKILNLKEKTDEACDNFSESEGKDTDNNIEN